MAALEALFPSPLTPPAAASQSVAASGDGPSAAAAAAYGDGRRELESGFMEGGKG